MVKRLSDMPEVEAHHLRRIECPTFDDTPALPGKPLAQRRVALISTAGTCSPTGCSIAAGAMKPSCWVRKPRVR